MKTVVKRLKINVNRCYIRNRRLRMRARHQEGWVELRGRRWYGHYYVYRRDESGKEVRHHAGVVLGDKSKDFVKWQAKAKLHALIKAFADIEVRLLAVFAERNLNAADQAAMRQDVQRILDAQQDSETGAKQALAFLNTKAQPADDQLTLEWYTRERFLPMKSPKWAPSTRETNLYNIEHHILTALGSVPLKKLDKFTCQMFLNELAGKPQAARKEIERKTGFSLTVIAHCRSLLWAILDEASEAELIEKNPARKLENPDTPEPEKFVLPKHQARALLEALPFRDRLLAMIAAFCAMRPGEIFGLRWSSWRGDHLQIEGTAWRGILRPGKAKTKGSKASVMLPDVLIPAMKMWQEQNAGAPAEAMIFPSDHKTPMRPENWLRRRIKPIAARLGITVPVNFQVLRRTFATNAQGYGNPKDVQAHLRHADISTTLGIYTQEVPESVRKLVNAVAQDVMTSEAPPAPAIEVPMITRRVQ